MKQVMFANEVTVNFMPIGNRAIDYKKVNNIKMSMQEYGIVTGITLIQTSLFTGKNAYYGVDGQHRYEAARALNRLNELPVYIVPKKFKTIKDIVQFVARLNSTQTPWHLLNYINAYASIGNKHYVKLLEKVNLFGLGCSILGIIYGGANTTVSARMIKDGSFVIIDEAKGDTIANILQDLIPIIGKVNASIINAFSVAFYEWYSSIKKYNHKKFMQFLNKNREKLLVLGYDGMTLMFADFK